MMAAFLHVLDKTFKITNEFVLVMNFPYQLIVLVKQSSIISFNFVAITSLSWSFCGWQQSTATEVDSSSSAFPRTESSSRNPSSASS